MSEQPADQAFGTDFGRRAGDDSAAAASLTPLALQYLDQTRPWVRFMSVVTYASAGMMVLAALAMLAASIFGGRAASGAEAGGLFGSAIASGLMACLYLLLAGVYIVPGLYLSRYATAIKRLKASGTVAGLEDALKHQKSFWRCIGVLTIVGVSIAAVVVGLAIAAGVAAFMMAAGR